MNASKIAVAVVGALTLFAAGVAYATTTPADLQVYKPHSAPSHNEMIAGDGIPIDNFTQNSYMGPYGNYIYVSLKARDRDTGEPTNRIGNYYYIDAGYASDSKPQLTYDFQFDPGSYNTANYYLQLKVDFDRSAATSFATIEGSIFDSWSTSDGYFTNTGSWNTTTVPYVISNSGNLGFAFWTALNPEAALYDPNQSGDYEMQLNVFDPDKTTLLASTTIHAIVGNPLAVPVPEPGELGLMGLGLLLMGGLGWRFGTKGRRANSSDGNLLSA